MTPVCLKKLFIGMVSDVVGGAGTYAVLASPWDFADHAVKLLASLGGLVLVGLSIWHKYVLIKKEQKGGNKNGTTDDR